MVDRTHRDLSEEEIKKLADTFEAFQNGTLEVVKGFCSIASLEDIAKQDYILTPGRYVGIEEQTDEEPFEEKMTRLTSELSDMFAKSHKLEDEIQKNLKGIGFKIEIDQENFTFEETNNILDKMLLIVNTIKEMKKNDNNKKESIKEIKKEPEEKTE